MAFDQTTRNRLQQFVSKSRNILIDEFTRQLQAIYGLDPKDGTIAELSAISHLDNNQRQIAADLREIAHHYVAGLDKKSEKEKVKEALDRIIREQAFTVLNRLSALRMAEARGFLLESTAKGFNSKGFQLYKSLSEAGLGETGEAYQSYLFSLFDEFSIDLAVLFDRHNIQGILFPKESVLLDLLEEINHFEIEPLWSEDETIGWIYQYFNSQVERKKMRAESSAPRNSRELAVRNQFFTPRYVVEFLTDNTLGRIWYEMTQGKTSLVEHCRHLVRRPNEIFLAKGESAPDSENMESENLSQIELLKQPVFIPFRAMKDPREIRMLDPACGSMHFGLYAFDLYEKIYEEAWQLEIEHGNEAFVRSEELKPLTHTYSSLEEFQRVIPKLIIELNIHGVDIDPRAVQIAGLSLWQKAQRTWYQMGVRPSERPIIKKSNIVCAEPMPGEKELLNEFTASLQPPLLGQLVESVFDKMVLAGEAGTLLKIEEELKSSIRDARKQWIQQSSMLFSQDQMSPKHQQESMTFDLRGIDDESFWGSAEEKIIEALRKYADQTQSKDGQRRLFAEDSAKGFAFIDISQKRFDLVLMNPPFGAYPENCHQVLADSYPDCNKDFYPSFLSRYATKTDFLGAITNRTGLTLKRLEEWRKSTFITNSHLSFLVDMGIGVLDALVETAMYVIQHNDSRNMICINCLGTPKKHLEEKIRVTLKEIYSESLNDQIHVIPTKEFLILPSSPIAYDVPFDILRLFKQYDQMEREGLIFRVTSPQADDYRFLRLLWEVPAKFIGKNRIWSPISKGGEYQPYIGDFELLVNWDNSIQSFRGFLGTSHRPLNKPACADLFFSGGITWSERTASRFSPRILPRDMIFSSVGPYCGGLDDYDMMLVLGIMMSRCYQAFLELFLAAGDETSSGSAARHYQVGTLRSLPYPVYSELVQTRIIGEIRKIIAILMSRLQRKETSSYFISPFAGMNSNPTSLEDMDAELSTTYVEDCFHILESTADIDNIIIESYGISDGGKEYIDSIFKKHPLEYPVKKLEDNTLLNVETDKLINDALARNNTGRSIAVKSFYADRHLEVLSHITESSPYSFKDGFLEHRIKGSFLKDIAQSLMSYSMGCAFGRWNIMSAQLSGEGLELKNPFEPIPTSQPGALKNSKGLPVSPSEISKDYPIEIPLYGIAVDDEEHYWDITKRIRETSSQLFNQNQEIIESEICVILKVQSIPHYINGVNKFFADHLRRYSSSRRQAPIYWPLQTRSGSYTLWVYYHYISDQTLYNCVNDFVEPKIKIVSDDLNNLRIQPARSSAEEQEMANLTDLKAELKDFRDELLRLAKFWKPNLNDGVQITAAPLWKLFQHKQWQNKLKETWKNMEQGEYDWAHLACSIWSERVLRKCHENRSLAIAHDVEKKLWIEVEIPVIRRGKDTGKTKMEWQPRELDEQELEELIETKISEMTA